MTITFTLLWWHVPAAVTLLLVLWLAFFPTDKRGYGGDVAALMECVISLVGLLIIWIIAGALK